MFANFKKCSPKFTKCSQIQKIFMNLENVPGFRKKFPEFQKCHNLIIFMNLKKCSRN